VFFGMLAASTVGIFLIPMLYVVFQSLREGAWKKPKGATPAPRKGVPALRPEPAE